MAVGIRFERCPDEPFELRQSKVRGEKRLQLLAPGSQQRTARLEEVEISKATPFVSGAHFLEGERRLGEYLAPDGIELGALSTKHGMTLRQGTPQLDPGLCLRKWGLLKRRRSLIDCPTVPVE